ncbi:MAG: peptidylprolyl isomerase [Alicyclobacillus sp.]|nr:peptidylprolyl isomerase [Alicyclobacillus sp.]
MWPAILLAAVLAGCGTGGNTAGSPVNQTQAANAEAGANTGEGNATSAGNTAGGKPQWSQPPAMQIDLNKQYDAVFHTNYGDFTVKLFPKESPKTVNNFVFLCQHHFYDGDKFFRIIQPFMIQTGDPLNNGTGGPGYQFADELPPKHPYAPGIVAMANAGPNTNGSQFFICTGPDAASLNQQPNYTEFGQVTQGMDVVQKIAAIPVTTNPMTGEQSYPTQDAFIRTIDIQVH